MNPEIFSEILLRWWADNKRNLPWKNSSDPYLIWLSEIILQQTRVDQGTPYFLKFIELFPNIFSLAEANEDEVLKVWEGLGYYSRARNLHFTAKYISAELNGVFPTRYEDILKLKGVGPNTAAAISSFAFGLPYPVIDGNVYRLISRILGMVLPIDQNDGKNTIQIFVTAAIKKVNPANFNQALMDFGALQCTPANPDCKNCDFMEYCKAYKEEKVNIIPIKAKKIKRKNRYFHYLDIDLPTNVTIINQRNKNDIWKKLYEFPMLETENEKMPERESFLKKVAEILPNELSKEITIEKSFESVQILTHRNIHGFFYKMSIAQSVRKINKDHYLVERSKVSNFAFPKIITDYLKIVY